MTRFDQRVMGAILALGGRTYAVPLHEVLKASSWFWGPSFGRIYDALERLEKEGWLESEYGEERPPERGYRRRKYYKIHRRLWHFKHTGI